MMIFTIAAVCVGINAVCFLVTWLVVRVGRRLRTQLRAARAELVTALEHIATAQAVEERLREEIGAQVRKREADFLEFRSQLADLRENYDRVIRQYQIAHGIQRPSISRRVQ